MMRVTEVTASDRNLDYDFFLAFGFWLLHGVGGEVLTPYLRYLLIRTRDCVLRIPGRGWWF